VRELPDFLSVVEVLFLHEEQLARYGGGTGIRDIGLLESAVAQPQATFGSEYLHADLFQMAAAYAFHIAQNQPFVDGNKRTGLVAALVFLDLNGVFAEDTEGSSTKRRSPSQRGAWTKGLSPPSFATLVALGRSEPRDPSRS
jgi:death-on-curing protein